MTYDIKNVKIKLYSKPKIAGNDMYLEINSKRKNSAWLSYHHLGSTSSATVLLYNTSKGRLNQKGYDISSILLCYLVFYLFLCSVLDSFPDSKSVNGGLLAVV